MTKRIVASSRSTKSDARYIIRRSDNYQGWTTMDGDYPDVNSDIAFAKAYGGPEWVVVEVTND